MAMPVTRRYTAADLASMPDDGQRYELIHGGLLVTPSPRYDHQAIVTRLIVELLTYLNPHGLLHDLIIAPADITLGPDTIVQPDLLVVDSTMVQRTRLWTDVTTIHLVIEVISPSTVRVDRGAKRQLYQEREIPRYWIVDGAKRHVEVVAANAQATVTERERLAWRHPALEDECVIDLVRLFDFP